MLVFDKRVKSEYPEKNTRGRVGIAYHVAELKLKGDYHLLQSSIIKFYFKETDFLFDLYFKAKYLKAVSVHDHEYRCIRNTFVLTISAHLIFRRLLNNHRHLECMRAS